MAELTRLVRQDATGRTTTSTTFAELTDYTVTWASLTGAGFAAGDDVFILGRIKTGNSGANNLTNLVMGRGTTFAGRTDWVEETEITQEHGSNNSLAMVPTQFGLRHTLVVDQNLYFAGSTSAGTGRFDDFGLLIIKLDDLTENTDFVWNEVNHSGDAPATYGTAGASVTIPSTDDYLLLWGARFLSDSTSADALMDITINGSALWEMQREGEDVDEEWCMGASECRNFTSGHVVQVRYRVDTATTHDIERTWVLALRLGRFVEYDWKQNTTAVTHSALDTYQYPISTQPQVTGNGTKNFLILADSLHNMTETTKWPYCIMEVQTNGGGYAEPAGLGGLGRTTVGGANGATDKISTPYLASHTPGTGTIQYRFGIAEDNDVTPNYDAVKHSILVLQWELTAGPVELTTGAPDGTSTVTGSIDALVSLTTAAPDGTSTVSASIDTIASLATAAPDGTSTVTAALSSFVPPKELASAPAGTSTVTGSIDAITSLSATSAGTSTVTAAAPDTIVGLATAAPDGTSTATGDIDVERNLTTAAPNGTSIITATLFNQAGAGTPIHYFETT